MQVQQLDSRAHYNMGLSKLTGMELLQSEYGAGIIEGHMIHARSLFTRPFVFEIPTDQANREYIKAVSQTRVDVMSVNTQLVNIAQSLRQDLDGSGCGISLSACIGPRRQDYDWQTRMSPNEAMDFHQEQIETLAHAKVDLITAINMHNPEEAVGIVLAARQAGIAVAVSFQLDSQGMLPCGVSLKDAVETVDWATEGAPLHYVVSEELPPKLTQGLPSDQWWLERISRGHGPVKIV